MSLENIKYESRLTEEFARKIVERFSGIELKMSVSDEEVGWIFAKIKHQGGFYRNGSGHLRFFLKMDFNKTKGLGKKIAENVHSGNEINKASRYLTQVKRDYTDDSYRVVCKLKKQPKNMESFLNNAVGYLMHKVYETINPVLG